MAGVSITDLMTFSGSIDLSDAAALSLAGLKKLDFTKVPVVGDLGKPIDQFPLDEVAVGIGMNLPAALFSGDFAPIVSGAVSAKLSILNHKRGKLFGEDQFAPEVLIGEGECWTGFGITYSLSEGITFSQSGVATASNAQSGFGVTLKNAQALSLSTFLRLPVKGSSALPSFKDGLSELLQSYAIPSSAQQLRTMAQGVAYVADVEGSVSASASYSAPLSINPLATLSLPFSFALKVQPGVGASVSGTVTLAGSFVIRCFKSSDDKLVMGLYKKTGTTLTAALTATAGVAVVAGSADVLTVLMNALSAPDLQELHLTPEQTAELKAGLKEAVDHGLTMALNACCTAAAANEAAVIYEVDLNGGSSDNIHAALTSALHGDWTVFESLPGARPLRNIVRELKEHQHKISINLLGIYNSTSIADYLKSTTVIYDEHGQVVIVDKTEAKSLSAGTSVYRAKAGKLRSVLAQSFVATVTYGASKGKLGVTAFSTQQAYLKYLASASSADIAPEILLARSVGLVLDAAWDALIRSKGWFNQNKFFLNTTYDLAAAMTLFYADVDNRVPHSTEELERIGRDAKVKLLDPSLPNSMARRKALSNDEIWNELKARGNVSSFGSIPGLSRLDLPALQDISADYLDIRWWADGMTKVAPALTALLKTVEDSTSSDPAKDPEFLAAEARLKDALLEMQSKTHSAFGDGWPLAVMFQLASGAGKRPSVEMDIGWNGRFEHYVGGGS